MTAKQRRQYWTKTERMRMKLEKTYSPLVRAALMDQARSLTEAVSRSGPQAVNTLPVELWNAKLMELYTKLWRETFFLFANATYNSLKNTKFIPGMGRAEEWQLYVQDWLRKYGLQMVTTISGNSKDLLIQIANEAIQQGIDQGLGASETARLIQERIEDKWEGYSRYRALRIVRTETVRAANEGHMRGADSLPFLTEKIWISAKDARTRQIINGDEWDHWDLDGDQTDLSEVFLATSKTGQTIEVQQPGDITAPPGFTINCRCRVAFEGKRDKNGRLILKPR